MTEVTAATIKAFRVGDDLNGYRISNIVGRTDDIIVCTVETAREGDVGVHWLSTDSLTFSDRQRACVRALNERYDEFKRTFPGEPSHIEALATAFFQGICSEHHEPEAMFERLDARLLEAKQVASNRSRTVYGAAAAVAALLVVLVFAGLITVTDASVQLTGMPLSPLYTAAMFGAIGSLASVLQKLRGIEVSHYPGFQSAAFGGIARILLGGIFGGALYLGATVGVLLSALVTVPGGVALIGLVGGISERLVPEMVSQFESDTRQT